MRIMILILACLFVAGCAEKVWTKPGASNADFYRNKAACEMGAAGIPQPAQQAPNPAYYTGNTTCYGSSCRTTITPGPDYSGLSNLGAAIGHLAAKQRYLDNCMIANGWSEQETPVNTKFTSPPPAPEPENVLISEFTKEVPWKAVPIGHMTLRSDPSFLNTPIRIIDQKDMVTVLSTHASGWTKVSTQDGMNGYVLKQWLKRVS